MGNQYKNLTQAILAFENKSIPCTRQSFPVNSKDIFSTLNHRGQPTTSKRAPVFVKPDGKRYNVNGKQYMKWSFDFRMSTAFGPVVHDIKFDGKHVIYELGLQEISVFYSGHSPQQRFSDYMDSGELIGPAAQGIIPGVDCPNNVTYFDTMHVTETAETADTIHNVGLN